MSRTASLEGKAHDLRSIERSPADLAKEDQAASEWRAAFDALGIALTPETALVAFATMQVVLFHLVDTDGDLEAFLERSTDGALVLARYVR